MSDYKADGPLDRSQTLVKQVVEGNVPPNLPNVAHLMLSADEGVGMEEGKLGGRKREDERGRIMSDEEEVFVDSHEFPLI